LLLRSNALACLAEPDRRSPCPPWPLVTAGQLARVQERSRTCADGMEIPPPCGCSRGHTAARPEAAGRCDVPGNVRRWKPHTPCGLLIYGQTWLGLNPSASSLSGCFSDQRHLLEPGSAGLSVCPRVTVTVPERPPDRARGGHDPLIRRSGRVVQKRPLRSVRWADIPQLSTRGERRPAAWQQYWQQSRPNGVDPRPSVFQAGHISSWRRWCECAALALIAVACRWLLLLLSRLLSGQESGIAAAGLPDLGGSGLFT
jgi:hypothetical protein